MAAIWPAIAVAVVVSFVSVWLNDIAVSWGRDGVRRVIIGSVEDIIYGRLRQQRSYSTSKMSINVKGVEGRRLIRPTLSFQPGGQAAPVTVSAAEAEMRADAAKGTLTISCKNGTIHVGDVKAVFPDTIERVVPLDTVSRKETVSTSPSEIAMADFPRARADQIAAISQIHQLAAAKTALAIFSGRMEQTLPTAVQAERQEVKHATSRLNRIIMEPWRRWANGFSCLCFVLVGAPMAIRMRNADFLTSFFLCFLPILVVYYPVFMLGVSRVKAGVLPPPAVWMGNILIMLWGLWLLRRVIRN
jgi:lipopolysaccharide export system permease protein